MVDTSKHLASMFSDTFSCTRATIVDDGFGGSIEKEIEIFSKEKCKLSVKNLIATENQESKQTFKLFIPKNVTVKQNDKLTVTRFGIKYNSRATQPFIYSSHQEIVLSEVIEENGD